MTTKIWPLKLWTQKKVLILLQNLTDLSEKNYSSYRQKPEKNTAACLCDILFCVSYFRVT